MSLLLPLVLVGPLLMLATAVVALWAHGPLGWLAAVLLVVGVLAVSGWGVRRTLRWWAGTKAPERPPAPARARPTAGGTGPGPAARPARPGGTSRG